MARRVTGRRPGRPAVYGPARPVTIGARTPRKLYDAVVHVCRVKHTTLTRLVCEGLARVIGEGVEWLEP